eukprot:912765-Pelagomonas_calceolata.AAC.1
MILQTWKGSLPVALTQYNLASPIKFRRVSTTYSRTSSPLLEGEHTTLASLRVLNCKFLPTFVCFIHPRLSPSFKVHKDEAFSQEVQQGLQGKKGLSQDV